MLDIYIQFETCHFQSYHKKHNTQIFSTQTDILLILLLLYKMAFVNLTSRNRCYYLIHTKSLIYKKIALTTFPIISYIVSTQSFCVCKPPWVPTPPHLTQGQTSSRAGRRILSDIKIGWRIKCTYSRVGILPVQEKMNNHYVLFQNMKLSCMYRDSTFFPEQTMSLLSTKYI